MIHTTFEREPFGRTLRGDVRMPEGPPPRTAVVVVHGFKGFKDWGFFAWVARRLVADGHAVVTFNFSGSGIGRDPVRFTEMEAFASNTYTRELEELAWVVDAVRSAELVPLPPRAVGLLGHSRGGADAILHAAERGDVEALVTWAATASLDRWTEETRAEWRRLGRIYVPNARTGEHMPLDLTLLEDVEANPERLDPTRAAAEVEAPWLIVHGTEDETVSPEDARALARAGRGRLHLVEGAGHTFGAGHPFDEPTPWLLEAVEVTRTHLARHLRGG